MRPSSVSLLAAAMFATAMPAQAPEVATAPDSGCKVGLFARQQGAGVTMWTAALEDRAHPLSAKEPKSGVHVVVSAREPNETLREVTLRVTYLPYGVRTLPVDTIQAAAGTKGAKRTFHLSAGDGASQRLAGNLLLGRVSGVQRVELQQIDFADGHSWAAPTANPCAVTPSGLMLVNVEQR